MIWKKNSYKEGLKHNEIISNVFKNSYKNIEFDMVGSFRRKNKDMGDIDILIKDDDTINLNNIIEDLKNHTILLKHLQMEKNLWEFAKLIIFLQEELIFY